MGVFYTTRERVKRALDIAETARRNAEVDDAIEASSRLLDGHVPGSGLLRRRFYPEIRTQTFDWPDRINGATAWRLWLNQHELISATTVVAGGVTIAATDYFLRPDYGPPYTHIEIDLDSSAAFQAGDTHQRAISIAGTYGHSADSEPAGSLAEDLDTSETAVDVTDSGPVGVGTILKADSERMLVTGKSMMDTTVNIDAGDSLAASAADVSITCSTTTGMPTVDETILIDSERMLVVDVAGAVITVRRAFDGSVLAAHSANADIYAPRRLTVTRGALGTTAATHSNGAALTRHVVPGLVGELCLAETLTLLGCRTADYAPTAGSGDNLRPVPRPISLEALREDTIAAYGRKIFGRAV